MAETSAGEEFDPKTGTFRPISRQARTPAPSRPAGAPATKKYPGLSEDGERYGVMYEVFSDAFKTNQAKYLDWGMRGVILVVFLLLLYEAISYRIALS